MTVEDIRREGEWSLTPLHETEQLISEMGLANSAAVLHPTGTVMLSRTASIGLSCIIGRPMATTQAFVTWTPNPALLCGGYLLAVLKAMGQQFDFLAYGATHLTIYFPDIKTLRIPLPPLDVQRAIAGFLLRETAKIDALVAEQERLMALLREKRQSVISHAVTKGLSPDAPMKASGVEWLGETPAHWSVVTLRRCSKAVQTGSTPGSEVAGDVTVDGMMWYTPGDFDGDIVLATSARTVARECVDAGEVKLFPAGSILVVSIGATLGKVGLAPAACSANQQINAVIPSADVDSEFLARSLSVKGDVMRFLSNASTIGIMNQEKTKEIALTLPPLDEQREICRYLASALHEMDTLTEQARLVTELLRERRAALIMAAVTGQIDVRGLATADAA